MSFRTLAVAGLVLLLPGCISAWGEGCSWTGTAPAAGSSFSYRAQGELNFPASFDTIIVEWAAADPNLKEQGGLDLPPGSTLTVAIGSEAKPRLNYQGQLENAYQVSYETNHSGYGRSLVAADEWIGEGDAHLVQSTLRAVTVAEGAPEHSIRFTRFHRPGILLSTWFVGNQIAEGKTFDIDYPMEIGLPPSAEQLEASGSIHLSVRSTRTENGGCVADLDGHLTRPVKGETQYRLTLAEGIPVPTRYHETFSYDANATELTLEQHDFGSGPALPALKPRPRQLEGLPREPSVNGLPAEGVRLEDFPTSLDEARNEARNSLSTRRWFENHPNALPTNIVHRAANPSQDEILDEWIIKWVDAASKEGYETSVVKRRPVNVLGAHVFETTGLVVPAERAPNPGAKWITIRSMADIFSLFANEPLQVLTCDLAEDRCYGGTHENTLAPFAGEPDTAEFPGLIFWMSTGLVLQDNGVAPSLVGSPAR